MTSSVAIVTGADSSFFHLLEGLILSVRSAAATECALCVLDFGLEEPDRAWARANADRFAQAGWDFDVPDRDALPRRHQALTCRPYLPRYFPGHEIYVWLDADTWVQDWAAVDLLVRAARSGAMGIVPEIDRAYRSNYDLGAARRWMHRCYRLGFGEAVARDLWWMPVLNAGVFSASAHASAWAAWAARLREGLERTAEFIDQTALNVAVYSEEVAAHFLPSTCNWLCNYAAPCLDEASGDLVEPNLPHERLGIVHLTGTRPKAGPMELRTLDGRTVTRWLKYRGGDY